MARLSATRKTQSGAVAVFVAVALIGLISAMAMAIDVGRLYVAQAELDKVADMASMAGAEVASGCKGIEADGMPGSFEDIRATVEEAIQQNGGEAEWVTGIRGSPGVEVGRSSVSSQGLRAFQPLSAGHPQADTVRVTLTRATPRPLVPMWIGQSATLVSSSTARQSVIGSFSLGSSLLNLNSANSILLNALLGSLLGSQIHLSAADYQSLANMGVSLGMLATAVGVEASELSDLLQANALTPVLPQVLDGLVQGLGDSASSHVAQLLGTLADAANNQPVPLSQLLIPVTDTVTDVPFINLLDLILALGASAASESSNPLLIPVGVTIPGVLTSTVHIQVRESPQIGIGRPGEAYAKTAALKVSVRIQGDAVLGAIQQSVNSALSGLITTVTNALRLVTLGLVNVQVTGPTLIPHLNLGIDVDVARAAARLDSVHCPSRSDPTLTAGLSASPSLASVNIGGFTGTPSASSIPPLNSTQTFNVLSLGLRASSLVNLGTLNLNVALDFSCANVGSPCHGPEPAYTAPFDPLPRLVDEFSQVSPDLGPPYALALGHYGDAPVHGVNPQSVGSSLDLDVDLNLRQPLVSGSGVLGGMGYLLNGLVGTVTGLLNPLTNFVGNVLSSVVQPLLALLGIQLGQATVYMNTVSIDRPSVVTRCIPGSAPPYGCPAN